jgi:hypothetical protein
MFEKLILPLDRSLVLGMGRGGLFMIIGDIDVAFAIPGFELKVPLVPTWRSMAAKVALAFWRGEAIKYQDIESFEANFIEAREQICSWEAWGMGTEIEFKVELPSS